MTGIKVPRAKILYSLVLGFVVICRALVMISSVLFLTNCSPPPTNGFRHLEEFVCCASYQTPPLMLAMLSTKSPKSAAGKSRSRVGF